MNAGAAPPPGETGYGELSPEQILAAVEAAGLDCDGRLLALNSYENRVYQVGCEQGPPVIAKFYRPGRWSDAAIGEEHAFTLELLQNELPVLAPLADADGRTLHRVGGYRFALYPRQGGRAPELDQPGHLNQLGRLLARVHNIGALRPFQHRPVLRPRQQGEQAVRLLLDGGFVPDDLRAAYESVALEAVQAIATAFEGVGRVPWLRLHGDAHAGNVLWLDGLPHLVDFDDALSGPAIQDLWMFLSGERGYMQARLADLLEGYGEFRELDGLELGLIEPLRTLRMVHYSAWLARRWSDPAFPAAFPWFGGQRYWQDQVLALREQLAAMQEPALELPWW